MPCMAFADDAEVFVVRARRYNTTTSLKPVQLCRAVEKQRQGFGNRSTPNLFQQTCN